MSLKIAKKKKKLFFGPLIYVHSHMLQCMQEPKILFRSPVNFSSLFPHLKCFRYSFSLVSALNQALLSDANYCHHQKPQNSEKNLYLDHRFL